MSIVLTAFTERGLELACRLAAELGDAKVWRPERRSHPGLPAYSSLFAWTEEQFLNADALVFVSAAGIAVRAIAPCVRDKLIDPAVVSLDEEGRFVIPLLSGHVGGANALARRIAALTGGTAVISTATDVNGRFAADRWAAERGMAITNRAAAKAISAALLDGKPVGFSSEFPWDVLPEGVVNQPIRPGFAVTVKELPAEEALLVLHPKVLAVGIGCKKGLEPHCIANAVKDVLREAKLSPESVFCLTSHVLKREEPGILALAREWSVPCRFYTAEELNAVPGTFSGSSFVRSVTGTDSVCERSAVLAAGNGRLLVQKTVRPGVTAAVAQKDYRLSWKEGKTD